MSTLASIVFTGRNGEHIDAIFAQWEVQLGKILTTHTHRLYSSSSPHRTLPANLKGLQARVSESSMVLNALVRLEELERDWRLCACGAECATGVP